MSVYLWFAFACSILAAVVLALDRSAEITYRYYPSSQIIVILKDDPFLLHLSAQYEEGKPPELVTFADVPTNIAVPSRLAAESKYPEFFSLLAPPYHPLNHSRWFFPEEGLRYYTDVGKLLANSDQKGLQVNEDMHMSKPSTITTQLCEREKPPDIPGVCKAIIPGIKSWEEQMFELSVPFPHVPFFHIGEPTATGGVATSSISVREEPMRKRQVVERTEWKDRYKRSGLSLLAQALIKLVDSQSLNFAEELVDPKSAEEFRYLLLRLGQQLNPTDCKGLMFIHKIPQPNKDGKQSMGLHTLSKMEAMGYFDTLHPEKLEEILSMIGRKDLVHDINEYKQSSVFKKAIKLRQEQKNQKKKSREKGMEAATKEELPPGEHCWRDLFAMALEQMAALVEQINLLCKEAVEVTSNLFPDQVQRLLLRQLHSSIPLSLKFTQLISPKLQRLFMEQIWLYLPPSQFK